MLQYLCFLIFLVGLLFFVIKSRRKKLPGPTGLPFLGNSLDFAFLPFKDIFPKLKKYVEGYPGLMEASVLGHRLVVLSLPETIEPLLSSAVQIRKGEFDYGFWTPFLKDGLLTSDGAKWRHRRKLLTPSFHFKILEDAMGSLSKNAQLLTSNLLATGGDTADIGAIIRSTTLKVICETAMGVELNTEDKHQQEYVEAVERIPETIMRRYVKFWLYNDFVYKLTNEGRGFYKDLNTVHSFTKKIISDRRKSYINKMKSDIKDDNFKGKKKAFLDSLLELEVSSHLTEEDICDEVDTFMFEGHDTTSTNLIFTIYLLSNHPEEQEKVAEEMMSIFGNDNRSPTMQDLANMNYLELVIKESLRLYPSVSMFSRTLVEDLKISEDVVVPAGYTAVIMPCFLHRIESHWDDPEEFKPERFLPGNQRHPFLYIPFSAGPRNCIGQKFAMLELKTILSTILRKCRFEAVTKKINLLATVILKTEEPIIVRVHPRSS